MGLLRVDPYTGGVINSVFPDALIRSRSHEVTSQFLAGLSLVVAMVWVGTAFVWSQVGVRILLAVVFALLAVLAVRSSRACVIVAYASETVIVRNALRTVAVPISDISGIDTGYSRLTSPQTGGRRSLVKSLLGVWYGRQSKRPFEEALWRV